MKGVRAILTMLPLLVGCAVDGLPVGRSQAEQLADRYQPNVVRLTPLLRDGRRAENGGFGFIVGAQAGRFLILTADHVVRDRGEEFGDTVEIGFHDQSIPSRRGRRLPQRLRAGDRGGDLAVVDVEQPPGLQPIAIRAVVVGAMSRRQPAWLIGRGDGRWLPQAQPGAFSAVLPERDVLQFEGLHAMPGSSGGPVVGTDGLLGMIVSREFSAGGMTDALPAHAMVAALRGWNLPSNLLLQPGEVAPVLAAIAPDAVASSPTAAPSRAAAPSQPSAHLGSTSQNPNTRSAYAALARGDEAEALRLFRIAAGQGDAWGQLNLANAYLYGAGGETVDLREAVRLHRLAADQGNALAQYYLATAYDAGAGDLPRDRWEAVRLYRLAAEQGQPQAMVALAVAHLWGQAGVAQDEREAVRLFQLAAEQNDSRGQLNLGMAYLNGWGGLPVNEVTAARLFEMSASQGNGVAQWQLGRMYEAGRGDLPRDINRATVLYNMAAVNRVEEAADDLRRLASAGRPTGSASGTRTRGNADPTPPGATRSAPTLY